MSNSTPSKPGVGRILSWAALACIPLLTLLGLLRWYAPVRLQLDRLQNFGMKVTPELGTVIDAARWTEEDDLFAGALAVGLLLVATGFLLTRRSRVLRVLWALVVVAFPVWGIVRVVEVVEDAAPKIQRGLDR